MKNDKTQSITLKLYVCVHIHNSIIIIIIIWPSWTKIYIDTWIWEEERKRRHKFCYECMTFSNYWVSFYSFFLFTFFIATMNVIKTSLLASQEDDKFFFDIYQFPYSLILLACVYFVITSDKNKYLVSFNNFHFFYS